MIVDVLIHNTQQYSNSQNQEPMETIPIEKNDHINAKSQKRNYPGITADKLFMESGACPPFIKPSKQDEDTTLRYNPPITRKIIKI